MFAKADEEAVKRVKEVLDAVKALLPDDSHIEHILSHLVDFAAIAERSKTQIVQVGSATFKLEELRNVHAMVLKWISETVRWGFVPKTGNDAEKIGARENPIVTVDGHVAFVSALFNRNQAGIAERRRAVRLFLQSTTTRSWRMRSPSVASPIGTASRVGLWLIEATAMVRTNRTSGYRAHVIKIHGSIDWHLGTDDRVWRVRDGDLYPKRLAPVLISPQFTKYLATQRDPFAAQFDLFRRALGSGTENVLAACGYSFGDEHINQEIELALQRPENKTTILAFSQGLNGILDKWRAAPWAKRLYIITESGLFVGTGGPFFPPLAGKKRDWWTFAGVTKILNSGAEACVL